MKKLFILAIISLLSLSLPSAALAQAPTSFNATMQVAVTSGGDVDVLAVTDGGLRIRTTGEKIQGQVIDAVGWDALKGALVDVDHSSNILLDPVTGQILDGHAFTTITIIGPQGTIEANCRSTITGFFNKQPGVGFEDAGNWNLVKATGVYAGIQSNGSWKADLTFNQIYGTYVGLAFLGGTVH